MSIPTRSTDHPIRIGRQDDRAMHRRIGKLPKRPRKCIRRFGFFAMNGGEDEHLAIGLRAPDFEREAEHGAAVCGGCPGDGPPRWPGTKEPGLGGQATSGFVLVTNRSMISSRFVRTTSFNSMSAATTVSRNSSIVSAEANAAANGP